MAFPSKYNSICKKCRKPIRASRKGLNGELIEGDLITKNSKYGWVHEVCPTDNIVSSNDLADLISQADQNSISNSEQVFKEEKEFVPSKYQEAIFEFVKNGSGNAVIEAVAGSGKTTTIVKALNFTDPSIQVAFLAFNRHIASELKNRQNQGQIPGHVHISTIHSLGYSILRKLEDKPEVDPDKVGSIMNPFWPVSKYVEKENGKREKLADSVRKENRQKRSIMRNIVGLCKATLLDYSVAENVLQMCERYGIELNGHESEILEQLPKIMEQCANDKSVIDYDDMIWLPLVDKRLKLHFDKFNFLFIDEAQDLNASQIEFVLNSLAPEGRIIAVGDRKQSLYGFRGADVDAIPRMIDMLNATVLPLSISYRCPRSVVERAKEIVPQIEASEFAKEGEIVKMKMPEFLEKVHPGDMVVCRTNAPLVKPAFNCIKNNKKAIIRGRDIGKSLVIFVERFSASDLGQLEILMGEYTQKEYNRLINQNKELAAEMVKDKHETIMSVSANCRSVEELTQRLEMLFSDSVTGVVFSSVHRAKGLESETVYILRQDLMPHPKAQQDWEIEQEWNTLYVALTRSKNRLVFVEEEKQYD